MTDNPPIKTYLYKNRKQDYIWNKDRILTPKTMDSLGSTKSKITNDENGDNVPHLENTEEVLLHCNIVTNDYQHDSRILYTFFPNKSFVVFPSKSLLDILPKKNSFLKNFKH